VPVDATAAPAVQSSYLIERAVDNTAREIGMTPDALRRKNLIKPSQLPYATPTGKVYDSGDFAGGLKHAQELIDWKGFGKRVTAAKRGGKLRGIGIATYIEACGSNGPETAKITLDRDGGVTVLIGSQSTGQGHHTSYAQLVADRLDLPPDRVRVVQGDTDKIATGAGTGGSSSIPVGGVSVARASRTLAEQLKIAADARSRRRRHGDRRRRRARRRHRPEHFLCRSRRASEGDAGQADGDQGFLNRQPDLSERRAYRRGRNRSGHRQDGDRELCGRR
jgi:carbon-monoxide dehydrogenase large subunit